MVTVSFPAGDRGISCCACGGKVIVTRTTLRCRKCGTTAPNAWVPKGSNPAMNPTPATRVSRATETR